MNIGIDLGTTYSACAYMSEDGEPHIVINSEGNRLTPSVVMEEENGDIVVGDIAKDSVVIMANHCVSTVKDFMGTERTFPMPSGKKYSPEEISAFILKKIRRDAENKLNAEVKEAVITVPAYFTDAQRKSTEDAGKIAGLKVTGMINEPTAAAISFAHTHKVKDAMIMVYDLGGGTFDVSIVSIKDKHVTVKATGGIRKLGGHFFDQAILNYVADYLLEKHDLDVYDDEYIDELQELSLKAEDCKLQLSVKESAPIVIKIGGVKEKLTITRSQFEDMIRGFYQRTESTAEVVLDDAKLTWADIDKILLVGGSSRIPMIAEKLKAVSGKEPSKEANPDEAVAMGAAIYANHGFAEVADVNSHSLGIVTVNDKKKRVNTVVIPRDTQLPAKISKVFYTAAVNAESINVEVTEGEDEDLDYVNILSDMTIGLPARTPKNTKVSIEMVLNENQLLHVFVRIETTPEVYKEVYVERKSNLSEEDIALKTALVSNISVA